MSVFSYSQAWMQYLPKNRTQQELTFFDYRDAFNQWCQEKKIDKTGYYYEDGEKRKAYGWKQFKRWEIRMEGWYDNQTGRFFDEEIRREHERFALLKRNLTDSYQGDWVNVCYDDEGYGNDGNGRINCIAFHPTDINVWWVGTPWGGLWRTDDFGSSWTPLSDFIGHTAIGAVAIAPDYPVSQTIYLGTGDRGYFRDRGVGILKSTDGGATWEQTSLSFDSPENFLVGRILILPGNDSILLAATSEGVYKSTDMGEEWNEPLNTLRAIDMEFHPADDSIIYVSTRDVDDIVYIYRSVDQGDTWLPVFGETGRRIELAVSPDEPDWVYAVVADLQDGLQGVYRSTNKGATFQLQYDATNILSDNCTGNAPGGQGYYDLCITVNPNDAEHVFVGGINIWKSFDAGISWEMVNDSYWDCGGVNHHVHVDQHWLEYHPSGQALYVCNDGGIYGSPDHGISWTNFSGGLTINQPYRISNAQQVPDKVIMGQQDNGTVLWENNTVDYVGGGDGTDCLINPINHLHQIRTNNSPYVAFTTDNWWTTHYFQLVNDSTESWFKPFILLPHDTVYYGLTDVWKSYDTGFTFQKIKDLPGNEPLKRIAVAPSNHQVFYFFNKYDFYKTWNDFTNYSPLTSYLPYPADRIYQMEIKNDDPNTIWITNVLWQDGHSVSRSTDGGFTWENISDGLPDGPWYDIIQNDLQTGYEELYVCGYFGVWVKLGNQDWAPFSSGLPNVVSFDMEIYYDGENSKLRTGTHGRGVWESDLFSTDYSQPWIWTGLANHNWHDARNWNYLEVPNGSVDVIIPAYTPHSPTIDYFPATCGSLTIKMYAALNLSGEVLTVVDSLVISGALNLTAPGSEIEVDGDVIWKPGSSFNANTSVDNKIRVYGDWTFGDNNDFLVIDSADVYFMGNKDSKLLSLALGCGFRNVHILKTPSYQTIVDAQSTHTFLIFGNLNIATGAAMTHNSLFKMYVYGDLIAEGNLSFPSGTLVLDGGNSMIQTATPGSFINHLKVEADADKYKTLASDIDVRGSLTLQSGHLDQAGYSISLAGDLERVNGSLDDSGSRIIFSGSNKQTIKDDFSFHIMELAKTADTLFIDNSIQITCQTYDWTEGTLAVTQQGKFTAQDLADDGIYGSYFLNSTQSINLTQDAGQSVDLNGKINIEGGSFVVNGGSGTSQWPGGVNAELWISDGLLNFKDQGIHLSNSASFLEVITGGVIRTSKSFTGERNDFTPAGGRIELTGPADADLSHGIGGAFWDVRIFKAGTVSAAQNLSVDNSLTIVTGSLDVNGKTVHVENLLDITGDLKMTSPSSQVSVDGDVIWKSGSSADISEGTISFKGNWYFNTGTNAQLAGNNTVKATSTTTNQYVYHQDSDACFANFSLEKPFVTIQRHLVLDNSSDYPMRVNGNLTLLSNNSLRIDSVEMIVGGNVQANSTSFIRVYETGSLTATSASIDGILNLFGGDFTAVSAAINYGLVMDDSATVITEDLTIDGTVNINGGATAEMDNLTLDGTIDLNDGALTVHNNFTQGAGGHLILDGGSFVLDKPYTGNLFGFSGITDLNGGFFEISYDGIQFGTGATVNFNGGTLRVGGHFRAINPNSFQPASGTVELINTIGANIEVTNGNYFHRLVINKSGTNPCLPVYALTVNDQFVLQRGEYTTLGNSLYIGDDLVIESLGKLTAGNAEIHVGGDWVNNRGTAGFVEGTSNVWLTPSREISLNSETFYDLTIHASQDPDEYAALTDGTVIHVLRHMTFSEGALLMGSNTTLTVSGDLHIKNNAGLNANPTATGTVINCQRHWWDYNTVADARRSFTCGQSTVNFTGAGDQQLIAYPGTVFHHLNIQKSGGSLLPSNNITVLGDMNLQSGNWSYGATGLTHTFEGDFSCLSGAAWMDDQNTVSFEGDQLQSISNATGNPLDFGMFRVDRPGDMSGFGSLTIGSDIGCSAANFVSGWVQMTDHDFDCMGDMNILADANVQFVFNSTIRMADNKLINVNGGYLSIGGDPVNRPLVTHLNSGYYKVYVHNGGSINAVHSIFEYLGTRGIEIASDGTVFGSYPFYGTTLREGIAGGSLFYMSSASDITLHNVFFPANTWSGASNVAKYEDAGNVYLPGAYGSFAGPAHENDPNGRVHWPSAGIWEGDESTEWHDINNWYYDFQVPDIHTDVIIPAGAAYYPDFHQEETTVKSLRIDPNASLTISKDSLTVLTFSDIHGILNLTTDNTAIFTDSLVWQAGSFANVVNKGTIYVSGNMFIKRNSVLQMTTGVIQFHGEGESDLVCHDTAQVFHLYNYKTPPYSLNLAGDTLAQLTISGNFRNGAGATLTCPSTQEWVFGGQFRNTDGGHFRCQDGTFRFTGGTPSTYFRPNQGDYLHNLVIETTSALNLNNTYSDSLRIRGDLVINPGTGTSSLTANNFKIVLTGDWINNKGVGGFIPGTSTLALVNPVAQSLTGNTVFYDVEAGSSSPGLISFFGDNTINNRLWVVSPVEVHGTLNTNLVFNDDGNSELHLRQGGLMQIGTLLQGGLVHGDGGTLMVSDLDEDYITGIYQIEDGLVALNQAEFDSPHDLRGSINISGGELRFTGGTGSSAWPSNLVSSFASITMTGGLFNLQNHYVDILNNNFTENISGGIIRVGYAFVSTLGVTTFHPTGGAVEIVSENDANVSILQPESHFWDLYINHSDAGGTTYPGSNFKIKNELRISGGSFDTGGFMITIGP